MRAVLLGTYIGDALAMPVHWYYDRAQLRRDFGQITTYEKPKTILPGSIMNLSSTSGAGRGSDDGNIVGTVILHGKKEFWMRGAQYHYHQGGSPLFETFRRINFLKGENTLDMLVSRELLRSMISKGKYCEEDYRQRYIDLMTIPGRHNDTYAGSCHRIFFEAWAKGVPAAECPSDDGENIECIDGIVGVLPVILGNIGAPSTKLRQELRSCIRVTRDAEKLTDYAMIYASLLMGVLHGKDLREQVQEAGRKLNLDIFRSSIQQPDPMVTCYMAASFPGLLHYAFKYADSPAEALLSSTNVGGENVARGALLGALMGAAHGLEGFPSHLKDGLHDGRAIRQEIDDFVGMVKVCVARKRKEVVTKQKPLKFCRS
ncbi:unnamed protein product [Choristocarpus tenellus]